MIRGRTSGTGALMINSTPGRDTATDRLRTAFLQPHPHLHAEEVSGLARSWPNGAYAGSLENFASDGPGMISAKVTTMLRPAAGQP